MGMIAHCTACRWKVIINGGGNKKKYCAHEPTAGRKRARMSDGLMAERQTKSVCLRRKRATVLRLGTGDVIPGMRALPAELRDAQVESALIFLIKLLGNPRFSSYGMFSANSVSEHFHVANFGLTPHPFFFLAPSCNRGRGDPPGNSEAEMRICTRREPQMCFAPRQKGGKQTDIVLIQQREPSPPRPYTKHPCPASSLDAEIACERYSIGPGRMARGHRK